MADEPKEYDGRPKFSDVIRALATPGASFEDFKQAMPPRDVSGPPADPFSGNIVAAFAAHEMFLSFMAGGFNEDQALKLVAGVIAYSGKKDNNQGG